MEVHLRFVVELEHMDLIVPVPEEDPVHMGWMAFSSSGIDLLEVEEI